eukprot:1351729-Prymnesium_polylepis.1
MLKHWSMSMILIEPRRTIGLAHEQREKKAASSCVTTHTSDTRCESIPFTASELRRGHEATQAGWCW